jgi:squamous cell carcinoma antigen recognized by T-cells 3
MARPVGESSWLDYTEQKRRAAEASGGLENRIEVIEEFRRAVQAEPYALRLWIAYCDYFWQLYTACHLDTHSTWSDEERALGRNIFSLDAALNLWHEGYEAVRYRLGDSHELWDRWVALEMEQLARTRTEPGVKRITHLFKARLATPQARWDETAQMFSSFLSEYNKEGYEAEMQDVSSLSVEAKELYAPRDRYELNLDVAIRGGDTVKEKAAFREYLDWEMPQIYKTKKGGKTDARRQAANVRICLGLFDRALTGPLADEEGVWTEYVVYISSNRERTWDEPDLLPNMLDTLQRAVQHCPWSGNLWSRYILTAEQVGLAFSDIETIKHAATGSGQLDRDGMMGVIEMYSAWCGYLKRTAMNPNAAEEAVDIAEVGLTAAIEDVRHWGRRLYGDAYQGDPNFRLEKIHIQYLTEKHNAIEQARHHWESMAAIDLHANSYDFWLHYYLWEMLAFQADKTRDPTPSTLGTGLRVPTRATELFGRALKRKNLDWPERIMEVYLQHCNDYQLPQTLLAAMDTIYQTKKAIARRRERQAAEAQAYAPVETALPAEAHEEPSSAKRKREEEEPSEDPDNKRVRNGVAEMSLTLDQNKNQQRDRENTSVMVKGLPGDTTMTKVRQYFRDYGHINNITVKAEEDGQSSAAFIEFRSHEEAESALLRDGKYFGQTQIEVKPGTNLTLFVTNYPPQADEAYLRDIFKESGSIFSIRWPSLKFNTHRRFCYVTFSDPTGAAAATKLDGTMLEGKFKLEAKYSDPSRRKTRTGAAEEGREVHVRDFGTETTEDDLRSIFGKHGKVASVRILRNMAGKSRGSGFVVFETKEAAEEAVKQLDKAKFRNQLLTVESSKPSTAKLAARNHGPGGSASPASTPEANHVDGDGDEDMAEVSQDGHKTTRADLAARSLAIIGIPDTVNDARLRAVLDPLGTITKLTLYPAKGGALVEFAEVKDAGKAALGIEGLELEGSKLHVGTKEQLFQGKGAVRVDRVDMPAKQMNSNTGRADKGKDSSLAFKPTAVRRPGLGSKGKPKH